MSGHQLQKMESPAHHPAATHPRHRLGATGHERHSTNHEGHQGISLNVVWVVLLHP